MASFSSVAHISDHFRQFWNKSFARKSFTLDIVLNLAHSKVSVMYYQAQSHWWLWRCHSMNAITKTMEMLCHIPSMELNLKKPWPSLILMGKNRYMLAQWFYFSTILVIKSHITSFFICFTLFLWDNSIQLKSDIYLNLTHNFPFLNITI